jgi:hypothetical protein
MKNNIETGILGYFMPIRSTNTQKITVLNLAHDFYAVMVTFIDLFKKIVYLMMKTKVLIIKISLESDLN